MASVVRAAQIAQVVVVNDDGHIFVGTPTTPQPPLKRRISSELSMRPTKGDENGGKQDTHVDECPICFEAMGNSEAGDYSPMGSVAIGECGHRFCRPCAARSITARLDRGQLPNCPTCQASLSVDLASAVGNLSGDRLARLLSLANTAMADGRESGATPIASSHRCLGRFFRRRDPVERAFQRTARRLHMKLCPNCGVPIVKNGGCDHMRCTHCNTNFNWSKAHTVVPCNRVHMKNFRPLRGYMLSVCPNCTATARVKLFLARYCVQPCYRLMAWSMILPVAILYGTFYTLRAVFKFALKKAARVIVAGKKICLPGRIQVDGRTFVNVVVPASLPMAQQAGFFFNARGTCPPSGVSLAYHQSNRSVNGQANIFMRFNEYAVMSEECDRSCLSRGRLLTENFMLGTEDFAFTSQSLRLPTGGIVFVFDAARAEFSRRMLRELDRSSLYDRANMHYSAITSRPALVIAVINLREPDAESLFEIGRSLIDYEGAALMPNIQYGSDWVMLPWDRQKFRDGQTIINWLAYNMPKRLWKLKRKRRFGFLRRILRRKAKATRSQG